MSNLPKVIKAGILDIGIFQLKVFILDDGRRIIEEQDMENFTKLLEKLLKNEKTEEIKKFSNIIYEFIHKGKMTKEIAYD